MNIKKLMEEKEALVKQIENLQSELKGLERAIRVISGTEETLAQPSHASRPRAKNVKDTVLGFVTKSNGDGITVGELMESAQSMGIALERGSVSSLLSRLKREGMLRIDDGRYYTILSAPPAGGGVSAH